MHVHLLLLLYGTPHPQALKRTRTHTQPPAGPSGKASFAQNLLNSQASQDNTASPASQPLTQNPLSMTQPSQPLSQDLSQVRLYGYTCCGMTEQCSIFDILYLAIPYMSL